MTEDRASWPEDGDSSGWNSNMEVVMWGERQEVEARLEQALEASVT